MQSNSILRVHMELKNLPLTSPRLLHLQVVVHTSDVPDGAFDGLVYLTLSGLEGSTSELPLVNTMPSNFGIKAVDTFTVRAVDVGALNTAVLRIVSVEGVCVGEYSKGWFRWCESLWNMLYILPLLFLLSPHPSPSPPLTSCIPCM